MSTTVSLYEACEYLRQKINKFEQYRDTQSCRRGIEEYPTEYPTLQEWERQFRAWEELIETEKIASIRERDL